MSTPVNNIGRLVPGLIEQVQGAKPLDKTEKTDQPGFSDLLGELIQNVNEAHHDSAAIQQAFIEGEPVELHQVMIKAREAGLATDLLLEIRNKLMNAYTEIMRMPM